MRGECEYMEWNITSKVVREVVWVKSVLRYYLHQSIALHQSISDLVTAGICTNIKAQLQELSSSIDHSLGVVIVVIAAIVNNSNSINYG